MLRGTYVCRPDKVCNVPVATLSLVHGVLQIKLRGSRASGTVERYCPEGCMHLVQWHEPVEEQGECESSWVNFAQDDILCEISDT